MNELSSLLIDKREGASQTPHVAILGESGLVGGALRKKLEGRGVIVTPLGRQRKVDLGNGRELQGLDLTNIGSIEAHVRALKDSGVTALVNSSAATEVNEI